MLLGNINYLIQKMSSTVVSSLMTGVPIIADSQVLGSYTFLKPEHVFLMGPKETEMDVMQRVSGKYLIAPAKSGASLRVLADMHGQTCCSAAADAGQSCNTRHMAWFGRKRTTRARP